MNRDDYDVDEDFDLDEDFDVDVEDDRVYYENYDEPPPTRKDISRLKKYNRKQDKIKNKSKKSKEGKIPRREPKSKLVGRIIFILCLMVLIVFLFLFSIKHEIFTRGKVGEKAVNYLYSFNTLDELESNLPKLESMCTEDVYNKIAVINSDKALNTYLKFKKNPVKVEIIESRPGYILYTLNSSSLSSGRKFLFSYSLGWDGRIETVREMECIDFYKES